MRRRINANCLRRIEEIMILPQAVDVVDKNGSFICVATIEEGGKVTVNDDKYDHPSHLRDTLIGSNLPTYRHFRYKGKLLSDWDVHP